MHSQLCSSYSHNTIALFRFVSLTRFHMYSSKASKSIWKSIQPRTQTTSLQYFGCEFIFIFFLCAFWMGWWRIRKIEKELKWKKEEEGAAAEKETEEESEKRSTHKPKHKTITITKTKNGCFSDIRSMAVRREDTLNEPC